MLPPWFDPDYYMADKLAQLQAESPSWTAAAMWQAFDASGLTPYEPTSPTVTGRGSTPTPCLTSATICATRLYNAI